MYKEVMNFNRERNGFKLDAELEAAMLEEEIKEFYDAETLAGRVDARIDLEFVWIGTILKSAYNQAILGKKLKKNIKKDLRLMDKILLEEMSPTTLGRVLDKARVIVCNANALKGKQLDDNGKVKKDEAYIKAINATELIDKMLRAELL